MVMSVSGSTFSALFSGSKAMRASTVEPVEKTEVKRELRLPS